MIKYYSTNGNSKKVSFKEALLSGLAPDKGLYMPERFPILDKKIYTKKSFSEMSYEVSKTIIEDEISDNNLKGIISDALNFEAPVKKLHDNIYILELFHGPTAAFKDFAARVMARTMSYFLKEENKKVTIIVATSGDTGSAVAKGFYKIPNIDIVILYPKNKVSYLQEKQLTTLGENITALEVRGTFDDCQHMAKDVFIDKELISKANLSSANSINIGRLFPQSFYYIWAYIQVMKKYNGKVIFCTPSGNFGNLTGGIIAKKMGLPVELFIAATNENDVVPEFLNTGIYNPRKSIHTFSNAMDVGNPSNFARILDIYKTKDNMTKDIIGYKATDQETIDIIKGVYQKYNYLFDPHTAVGYKAVLDFISENKDKNLPIILLSTAHPAKFNDIIKKAIGEVIPVPSVLEEALRKEKHSIEIDNTSDALKEYLLNR
jgi:threonine synthase